jgi:Zn-finger nucleic acid-binding protein
MKCPTDSATLVMSERAGIEIDYCPECRGVWLDRGELDKILERAAAETAPAPAAPIAQAPPQQAPPQYVEPRYDDRPRDDSRGAQQPYRKKKKEHWLSELFD